MNFLTARQYVIFNRQDLKSLQVKPKLKNCQGLSSICLSFILTTPSVISPMLIGGSMPSVVILSSQQSSSSLDSCFLKRPTDSCFLTSAMRVTKYYQSQQQKGQKCDTKFGVGVAFKFIFHQFRLYMKSDLKESHPGAKNASVVTKFQGRLKEGKKRRLVDDFGPHLEERDSLCRLVRRMQRQERGALQMEIQKQQSREERIKVRRQSNETPVKQHFSLFNSRRIPKAAFFQGGQSIDLSFATAQAKKSLIIKNLHLSTSPSNEELYRALTKQPQNRVSDNNPKSQELSNLIHLNLKQAKSRYWKDKHRDRYFHFKDCRMKTQGDLDSLASNINKSNIISLQRQKKLPNIRLSFAEKRQAGSHTIQESLSSSKDIYLKITKMPYILQQNKLYFTDNPKALIQTPSQYSNPNPNPKK